LKEDGRRHLDLADGIEVGNLHPGHAYSAKQEEVAKVSDADSEETLGTEPEGRREKDRRESNPNLNQLERVHPSFK